MHDTEAKCGWCKENIEPGEVTVIKHRDFGDVTVHDYCENGYDSSAAGISS